MSFLGKIFGQKPIIPNLPGIDATQIQQNTVTGNTQTLPGAEALASQVNTFNQSELDRLYNLALPGYDRIKQSVASNIADWTNGVVPQDVSDAVSRDAAARSLYGGYGGSGMAKNLAARDLGLKSLDLMSKGMDSAQRWLQTATAPRFDVTSMFLSPTQRYGIESSERNLQFQRSWLQNQIDAAPDPIARGFHDMIMGAVNSFLGGTYTGYDKGPSSHVSSSGVGGGGFGSSTNADEEAYFNSGMGGGSNEGMNIY